MVFGVVAFFCLRFIVFFWREWKGSILWFGIFINLWVFFSSVRSFLLNIRYSYVLRRKYLKKRKLERKFYKKLLNMNYNGRFFNFFRVCSSSVILLMFRICFNRISFTMFFTISAISLFSVVVRMTFWSCGLCGRIREMKVLREILIISLNVLNIWFSSFRRGRDSSLCWR